MVTCPMCDAVIDVDEEDLDEGDPLSCDECGASLRVVSVDPLEIESGDGIDLLVQPRRQPLQRVPLGVEEPERFRPFEILLIREKERDSGTSARAGHARGLHQEARQGDGGGLVGAGAGGADVGGLGVRGSGEEKEQENLFHFAPPLK